MRFDDWENYFVEQEEPIYFLSYEDEDADPTFLLLTGKARVKEIRWKDMTPEQQSLFRVAIAKEWDMWIKYQVTRALTQRERAVEARYLETCDN